MSHGLKMSQCLASCVSRFIFNCNSKNVDENIILITFMKREFSEIVYKKYIDCCIVCVLKMTSSLCFDKTYLNSKQTKSKCKCNSQ